jgi:uracil-DNA glycosylase
MNKAAVAEYFSLWKEYGIDGLPKEISLPESGSVSVDAKPQTFSKTLSEVRAWLGDCTRCSLCQTRKQIVFGTGSETATLMFVGEGPGADEDASGLPFVGKAGQLLTKIIEAMGTKREDVYIANVVKCRPPQNRVPEGIEIESCSPFLRAQIEAIQPKVIVALGVTAANYLTGKTTTMSNLRGKFQSLHWKTDVPIMPTYHPAYLLRNPDAKKIVWEDMKQVIKRMQP